MKFGLKYNIGIGALFILFSVVLQLQGYELPITTAVMVAGIVFLVRGMRIMKYGKTTVEGDERTRKIGAFASAYSWFLSLMAMAVLFWVDYLGLLSLSVQQVLGILLFFMIFTLLGFRWYLSRRGDAR
jgi:hypothetical protein